MMTVASRQGSIEAAAALSAAQIAWSARGLSDRLAYVCSCADRIAKDIALFRSAYEEEGLSKGLAKRTAGGLSVNGRDRLQSIATMMTGDVESPSGQNAGELLIRRPDGVVLIRAPAHAPTVALVGVLEILLAGNAVVLLIRHPSAATRIFAATLARVADELGYGAGLFALHVEETRSAIARALTSSLIRTIVFYGSEVAGRNMAADAVAVGKKAVVEATAANALLVWADAEIKPAVESAAGAFELSGRPCIAPHHVLCHPSVVDEVTESLVVLAEMQRSVTEDPAAGTQIPLASGEAQRTQTWLRDNMEVVSGGRSVGSYLSPAVGRVSATSLLRIERSSLLKAELLVPVTVVVSLDSDPPLQSARELLARLGKFHRVSAWTRTEEVVRAVIESASRAGAVIFNARHTSDALLGGFFVSSPMAEAVELWAATSNRQTVRCVGLRDEVLIAIGAPASLPLPRAMQTHPGSG